MKENINKRYLQKRKRSVNKIQGTLSKPRLSVFKSNNHIYAQLINDMNGKTLISYSTINKLFEGRLIKLAPKEAAYRVGVEIGKASVSRKITTVVFDRSQKPYRGRIEQLASGARSAGLTF
jgi:large subunit ribosomal protein L18